MDAKSQKQELPPAHTDPDEEERRRILDMHTCCPSLKMSLVAVGILALLYALLVV
ncbi:MAG: hypothetical protein JSS83_10825 [Cyanobacteria bacterium SZAS LIN-3]|nr:hypothetical protein [Cyanobacteria bacterium SZAS LIN-3]